MHKDFLDENVQNSHETKFSIINKTDQPMTFREPQSSQRKKSDSRYQRFSCMEQDFSLDFENSKNMFAEFDLDEKE